MLEVATLHGFPASHFVERARWVLDAAGVTYREVAWAPGPHLLLKRRLGLAGSSLPVLEREGSSPVQGSDAILDALGLPGRDPEVERLAVDRAGPGVRTLLYAATAGRAGARSALVPPPWFLPIGEPAWQRAALRLAWPALRAAILRGYGAGGGPAAVPSLADARLGPPLDALDGWVASGRLPSPEAGPPGAAAITAAAMLAPLARPPSHPLYAAAPPVLEGTARADWLARPCLAWARALYAAHRPRVALPG